MLRVFRIAKLSRHNSNLRVMISTMRNSTGELCFMLTLMALSILVFSSACYLAEKQVLNTKFTSIPQSIWWSCITMTTVGYGDVVPATTAGKRMYCLKCSQYENIFYSHCHNMLTGRNFCICITGTWYYCSVSSGTNEACCFECHWYISDQKIFTKTIYGSNAISTALTSRPVYHHDRGVFSFIYLSLLMKRN